MAERFPGRITIKRTPTAQKEPEPIQPQKEKEGSGLLGLAKGVGKFAFDLAGTIQKFTNPTLFNLKSILPKFKAEKFIEEETRKALQYGPRLATQFGLTGLSQSDLLKSKSKTLETGIFVPKSFTAKQFLGDRPIRTLDPLSPEAQNPRKTLLDAITIGSLASFGGGALIERSTAHAVAKFTGNKLLGTIAGKSARALGRFGIGGDIGVTTALIDEDEPQSPQDILKRGALFGGIAAALPPTFGFGIRGIQFGLGKLKGALEPFTTKIIKNLEDVARQTKTPQLEGVAGQVQQQVNQGLTLQAKVARTMLSTINLPKKISDAAIDRFGSFARAEKKLEATLGRKLTDDEQIYVQARLTIPKAQARASFAQDDLELFTEQLQKEGLREKSSVYLSQLDFIDRARLGQKVAGGKTLEQLENEMLAIRQEFGNDLPRLEEIRQHVQNINRSILDEMLEVGLISEDLKNTLIKTHPNYIPHEVMAKTIEDIAVKAGVDSTLNVTKNQIRKAVGSDRAIEDPFIALNNRMPVLFAAIEKNRTMVAFTNVAEQFPEIAPGIQVLRKSENVIARRELAIELGDVIRATKSQLKELKREFKFNKKLGTKIEILEQSLAKQEEDLRKLVNEFFEDESILKGIISERPSSVTKIPVELESFAKKARAAKTFKEFQKTKESGEIIRRIQSGEMESFGFFGNEDSALRKFFNASNGDFIGVKPPLIKTTVKVTAEKLGSKQKEIRQLIRRAQELKDLDLTSSDDAVNFLSDTITILKDENARIRLELRELADIRKTALQRAEEGTETISLFKNGVKEEWLVPKDIGIAIKNLDAEQLSTILRVMSIPAKILRNFATSKNPSFFIPNMARDVQTGVLNAEEGVSTQAFIAALARDNPKLLRQASEDGALFGAAVFREGESVVRQQIAGTEGKLWHQLKKVGKLDIVEEIAERTENATRLSVYHKALTNGASRQQAAFTARNATVDFSRMGTLMRQVNSVIPFLNARVQGTLNVGRSLLKNPERFARIQMWTAAYPSAVLYSHNRQFKSYENIPNYFTDNFWVIMVGEVNSIDDNGNPIVVPQFVTIPKGEGQKMVSNPVEHFLKSSDGINSRETADMLKGVLGSTSPLTFQSFSGQNLAQGILASTGPIPRILTGVGTNIDPFTGLPIIPPSRLEAEDKSLQFSRKTKETSKELADLFGMSPANFEFIAESFGGVPKDVLTAGDILQGGLPEGISTTPFGAATRVPGARAFVREVSEQQSLENILLKDKVEEIRGLTTNEKIKKQMEFNRVIEEIISVPQEQRANKWNELVSSGVINESNAKDFKKRIEQNLSYSESELKQMGVTNWGRAIALKAFFDAIGPERSQEKWVEFVKKKIITKDVARQLHILFEQANTQSEQ